MSSFANLPDDTKVCILKFAEEYKGGISRSLQQHLRQIRSDIINDDVSINTINNIAVRASFNGDKDLILKILKKYPFSMKTHYIISKRLLMNGHYDILKEIRFNNINSDKSFDIKCHWDINACNQVAHSGNIKMLQWMCNNDIQGEFHSKPNTSTCVSAVNGLVEKIYSTNETQTDIIDTYEHWEIIEFIKFITIQNIYSCDVFEAATKYSGDSNIRHHIICSIYNILHSTAPYFRLNADEKSTVCQESAMNGYIETLEWLEEDEEFEESIYESVLAGAAIGGQINIITKYVEKYNYGVPYTYMYYTLHNYILKYPYKEYDLNIIKTIYDMISVPYNVDNKEKWFVVQRNVSLMLCYEMAAIAGDLDIIIWLSKTKRLMLNLHKTNISTYASSYGHLHIVKWLYYNYKKSFHITEMYDGATTNNHISIIQFLNSVVPEKKQPKKNIYTIACHYGHIDILKMTPLTDREKKKISILECCTVAVENGHLNILEWIIENIAVNVSDLQKEVINAKMYSEYIERLLNTTSKRWYDTQNKKFDILMRCIPDIWNAYVKAFKRYSNWNRVRVAIENKLQNTV